jgi:hypothetical protein
VLIEAHECGGPREDRHAAAGPAGDGGAAGADGAPQQAPQPALPGAAPPPFEHIPCTEMPADAVETSGGCACCEGPCSDCACAAAHAEGLEALALPPGCRSVLTLLECGPACACARGGAAACCAARTTQRGVAARLAVARYSQKVRGGG